MKIFLSYASEQSELAKEIVLALRAENHTVFFDRSFLVSGEPYNAEIRKAIEASRVFVFLISPDSVTKGRYTLTELEFAEHKWPKPWGYVLPVMVMSTPKADIPPYLRAGRDDPSAIGKHPGNGCSGGPPDAQTCLASTSPSI